jgi:hypothetical protein
MGARAETKKIARAWLKRSDDVPLLSSEGQPCGSITCRNIVALKSTGRATGVTPHMRLEIGHRSAAGLASGAYGDWGISRRDLQMKTFQGV